VFQFERTETQLTYFIHGLETGMAGGGQNYLHDFTNTGAAAPAAPTELARLYIIASI
jgi:hypothetical protein